MKILIIRVIKMEMHFLNSEMQQRSVRKEEAIYPLLLLHLYFSCNSTSLLQYTLQCTMQNARYTAKAIHPLLLLKLYFPAILPPCTAMHNTKRKRHLDPLLLLLLYLYFNSSLQFYPPTAIHNAQCKMHDAKAIYPLLKLYFSPLPPMQCNSTSLQCRICLCLYFCFS